VVAEDDSLRLSGFTSPIDLHRSNRREIHFFVNGRPVQDAALVTALIKAYQTLLMVGKYPQAILFLELPPQAVDVNVHPAKAEVRFRYPDRVFSFVQSAVRRALLAYTPVPQLGDTLRWGSPSETLGRVHNGLEQSLDPAWAVEAAEDRPAPDEEFRNLETAPDTPSSGGSGAPAQVPLPGSRIPLLRMVGQVALAYLVAEGPDGLYLVDQHAAHERVLFERFMGQRSTGAIPSQALLQPAVVELPFASARLVSEALPVLSGLGFEIEPFGPGVFLVRSVPAILAGMDPAAALRVLVEDFEEDETPLQAEVEARIIARVCKRALKLEKTSLQRNSERF
jgi:DNA mismatch repair protein MutL